MKNQNFIFMLFFTLMRIKTDMDVGIGNSLTSDLRDPEEFGLNPIDQAIEHKAPENLALEDSENELEGQESPRHLNIENSHSTEGHEIPDNFKIESETEEEVDPLGFLNPDKSEEDEETNYDDVLKQNIDTHHNLNGYFTPNPYPEEQPDDDIRKDNRIGDDLLDKLLDEFRVLKCYKENEKTKIPDFCAASKETSFLNRLGTVDYSPLMLYNWLDQHLYKPLGYKMYAKFTFPDVFSNFLDISKQDSMIHPEMEIPNNATFMKSVLDSFKNIEDFSTDFNVNKDKISNSMVNLLKKFHIFWNVHRQRNQLKNLHSNTLDILRNILLKYKQTNDAMKATTINILANIKNAYYRFLRAHKLKNLIEKRPGEMLTVEILRRYKNNIEKIHSGESSFKIQVQEIAYILDLLRAFFIMNFKNDFTDSKNEGLYDIFIEKKIKTMFVDYQKYLLEIGDQAYNDFKDFTSTLILKMRLRKYIIFDKYTIEAYVNMPISTFKNEFGDAIKIYYEFIDSMMIVPSSCDNLIPAKLHECVQIKSSQIIVEFHKKYQLSSSIAGADLYTFIKSNFDHIISSIDKKHAFDNLIYFKHEYFNQVFTFAKNFRQKYHIKDMKIIENLENEIGFQVEKSKAFHTVSKVNYSNLDDLDRQLYELFLKIKSKFNKYSPINKDFKVMMIIAKTIDALLEKFIVQTDQTQNINLINLVSKIKEVLNAWLKDHSIHYVINSHPMNVSKSYADAVEVLGVSDLDAHEALNKGVISSNMINPIGLSVAKITGKRAIREIE